MLDREYRVDEIDKLILDRVKTRDLIEKREIEENKKALQKAIDRTYEKIIELYKQHDIELAENPMLESALKRSYGSKVGGIVNRRNKLKRELSLLDE